MADSDKPLLLLRLEVLVGAVALAGRGDERREMSTVLLSSEEVDEFWIKLCPGPVALDLKELVVRVGNVVRPDVVEKPLVLVGVELTDRAGAELDMGARVPMELEELSGLLTRLLAVLLARLLELPDVVPKLEREMPAVLRLKLLLLVELPKLERELVLLDKELEPVLRVEVLRDILLDDWRAEVVVELACREELTADWRAARVEVWRLEDCKALELLELLVDDDRDAVALVVLWVADPALLAVLFFWKAAAEVMLKPTIPRVTAAIMAQAAGLLFVLSTCHFMTCTPIYPTIFPGLATDSSVIT